MWGSIFNDAYMFEVLAGLILVTGTSLQEKTQTVILRSEINWLVGKAAVTRIHCRKCPSSLLWKSKLATFVRFKKSTSSSENSVFIKFRARVDRWIWQQVCLYIVAYLLLSWQIILHSKILLWQKHFRFWESLCATGID